MSVIAEIVAVGTSGSKKCPDCDVEMRLTEDVDIRTGGKVGWSRLFWGEVAEYFEDFLSVDVYFCPRCEQVRLYRPARLKKPQSISKETDD